MGGAPGQIKGDVKLFMAYVSWPGYPNATQSRITKTRLEIESWYREASSRQARLRATMVPVRLPGPPNINCSSAPRWWSVWEKTVAAASQRYRPEDGDLLGIVVPSGAAENCTIANTGAAAFGFAGDCRPVIDTMCGLSMYTRRYATTETIIHETLHNLGLRHANSVACSAGITNCISTEYGDPFDPMGGWEGYYASALINPIFADQLGWFRPGAVRDLTTRRSYRLSPYGGRTGLKALRIPFRSGQIYIEYRANAGRDKVLYENIQCPRRTDLGILIRMKFNDPAGASGTIPSVSYDINPPMPSYLIDANPRAGSCSFGLLPGQKWNSGEFEIHYVRNLSGRALIEITRF